ncbi:monooxygenase [Auriscalpium vulgare]|uniref:Monooxygenase n=1 Tax=Auriscalpium vulgare TaxID=40419 RepID=A0ACB8RR95_9AGAM|nr:monooxygenase [Auriscalpium vulgare]
MAPDSALSTQVESSHTAEFGVGQVVPPGSSGISIIVVGCGFAGLACAIESVRKGHSVVILEKQEKVEVVSLNLNVGRFIMRWGLHDKIWPICGHATELRIHNHLGELLQVQPFPQSLYGSHSYNGHRGELYEILVEHARSIGVDIRLGQRATEYWEDENTGTAGVVVRGERLAADVVVGADGLRSTARKLVLGYDDKPKPSGYAIYRTWFDARAAGIDADPLTTFLAGTEDVLYGWIGQDTHFLASNCKQGSTVSCVLTHVDGADIDESWSFPGNPEDVLAIVKDWDPRCAAILSKAPAFVDWKIVHREPLPTWISNGGRLALIGDAAHPFLPTSIQGASQAIEDGVTLAVTLQLAGKSAVPMAVRAFETIRYTRVRYAQLLGESTREKWHRADAGARGAAVDLPRPEWLLDFDAERHAYDVYAGVAAEIARKGYRAPVLP